MNKHNLFVWIRNAAAVLATGFLVVSSSAKGSDVPDSEQVSKLLSEAKTLSFQLKEDAATMESYTRANHSWQSHAAAITQIKEHVNALERQVTKLKDARNSASPWQKTAIDRINPFLDELGGYTSAIIEHLNGEQRQTFDKYKDYLEANADYAADLAAMIADFVDYGKTKQRMERLAAKLEVPVK
jgi:chromosome segregation ATPase